MTTRTLFPEFALKAGTTEWKSGGKGELWRLKIARAFNSGADEAFVQLGRSGEDVLEPGESLEVDLGYEGDHHRVFTGTVTQVVQGLSAWEIHALGTQNAMMQTRVDKSFQAQKAGEIFEALANESGAAVDQAEKGPMFSSYLADSSASCWEHALRLAFHGGCDLHSTVDGKLVFAPLPGPSAPKRLRFGADLIQTGVEHSPVTRMPRFYPESPASSGGEDTWLAKDISGSVGEAGDGAPMGAYHPLMRTQEHAQIAADTHLTRLQRAAKRGRAELVGSPELDLGAAVQLESLPGDPGGVYQILALEHLFDFRRGFRTLLHLAAAEGGL